MRCYLATLFFCTPKSFADSDFCSILLPWCAQFSSHHNTIYALWKRPDDLWRCHLELNRFSNSVKQKPWSQEFITIRKTWNGTPFRCSTALYGNNFNRIKRPRNYWSHNKYWVCSQVQITLDMKVMMMWFAMDLFGFILNVCQRFWWTFLQ